MDDGHRRIELGSTARVATYVLFLTPFKVGRGADIQLAGTQAEDVEVGGHDASPMATPDGPFDAPLALRPEALSK